MFQWLRSWLDCVQEVASCNWWSVAKGKVYVDYLKEVKMLKGKLSQQKVFLNKHYEK
jgi:hypothetical protein